MTIAEVKALPVGQKLRIMETLWQDMQEHFEAMPVPDDVKKLLDGRRERVERGETSLLNWDEVKAALGRG
jgi:putative addiction module component (TIGR02574 family)